MAEMFAELAARELVRARWYAGKGRPLRVLQVTALPWYGVAKDVGPGKLVGVRPVLVTVAHDDVRPAATDTYQFLLAVRRLGPTPARGSYGPCTDPEVTGSQGEFEIVDAPEDPEAMGLVLATMTTTPKPISNQDGSVRHHALVDLPRADLSPRPFRGEQSNTSVFFGDALMLKIFRRLEMGRNPDIAVHSALGKEPGSSTAVLYGWTEAEWSELSDERSADLAMLVERFRDAQDGWTLAVEACAAGADFSAAAAAMGRALREIHQGLAHQFPTSRVKAGPIGEQMGERLDSACGAAPQLLPYGTELGGVFSALEDHKIQVQRVHGDFHLGQVLRTPDGWRVIDFEGEPLKTLAERVAPDSPWRDVAGMLRSFDYAAAAAQRNSAVRPEAAEQWRQQCRTAFLEAYHQGMPTDFDLAVLRAYEADKAVYEVFYEIRNRPDWVSIPLRAVAEIVSPSLDNNDEQSPIQEEK